MKKIVYDCDLTLGVPGCDVDDGLALIFWDVRKQNCLV